LGPRPKRQGPKRVLSEIDKACSGFSASQAERIRRARNIPADVIAREIEATLNPKPPKRGGGAPGKYQTIPCSDKRLSFKKLSTGMCTVSMGTPSLFEPFSEEDEKMKELSGMRKSEVSYMKSRLEEFSVGGEFNRHNFTKVMRHYGVTDLIFIERFFEMYQDFNGREHIVTIPRIVEALCVFKNGSREDQLRILFKLIDVDGSRSITAMELFEFVCLMTERLKVRDHLFAIQISGGETGPMPLDPEQSSPPRDSNKPFDFDDMEGLSTVRKVQYLFKKLDISNDGDVSLEEFVSLIVPDDELFATFRALNPFSKMATRPIT